MARSQSGNPKSRGSADSLRNGAGRPPAPVSADPTGSVIDPAWLLKALALTIGIAVLCGYATFCLLFYQGQWQLILHPTRDSGARSSATLSQIVADTSMIRFGPDGSGVPQLTGWWLPAASSGRYRHLTVLYLPTGDGQVAKAASRLSDLHRLGLNVFAFDYRGFGESLGPHPNQARMEEDARTALHYLSSIRAIPESRTVLYGSGLGGALAVSLLESDPSIPAIILEDPQPNILEKALSDPRARILPVRLLFRERFPLFPALATSHTPKLILTIDHKESARIAGDGSSSAADPKMSVEFPAANPDQLTSAVARFLDQYAPPTPAPELIPRAVPSPAKLP